MSEWKGPWKCDECGFVREGEIQQILNDKHCGCMPSCDGQMQPHERRARPDLAPLLRELMGAAMPISSGLDRANLRGVQYEPTRIELGRLEVALARAASALAGEPGTGETTERRVREYLAFSHTDGKCNIYADDGELQCANLARHGRTIDFRREPLDALLDIIIDTRQREYRLLAEGKE